MYQSGPGCSNMLMLEGWGGGGLGVARKAEAKMDTVWECACN